jgi:hypothetical protein
MGLSFTIAAGPRQRSHSQVRVPRDSWPHFTVSYSRPLQPGRPGPRIYISQEQGSLVIPSGTGFPFRRLLRLAGLRWRYSTPPPHGKQYFVLRNLFKTKKLPHYKNLYVITECFYVHCVYCLCILWCTSVRSIVDIGDNGHPVPSLSPIPPL